MSNLNNPHAGLQFGLLYFSSGEETGQQDKYRLVVEGARFADQHGFGAVWIPERHTGNVGVIFPNPAVVHAALARETRQIHLRAGSVVVPLHDPIRIAEDWAVVDNLSQGRVGLSFASGWHPDDFVFYPAKYADRQEEMYRSIEIIQKLWQGDSITRLGGDGKEVKVRVRPTPIQKTLPFWVTAAGNPKTFIRAGEIGAHLLTHLFNQSIDEAAAKIALYRKARADSGHDPATGHVALMVHTFLGADPAAVREQVRGPFNQYLASSADVLSAIALSQGQQFDLNKMSEEERQMFLNFVFERLLTDRVLFGSPESCFPMVERLRAIGANEIACQLDFGVDTDLVLQSLPHLNRLKKMCDAAWGPALIPSGTVPATRNGQATVLNDASVMTRATASLGTNHPQRIQSRCPETVPGKDFYKQLRGKGIQFPGSFPAVEQLWRGKGEALARVRMPEALDWEANGSQIHPALLDICVQVLLGATFADAASNGGEALFVPGGLRSFEVHGRPGRDVWMHAVAGSTTGKAGTIEGDLRLLDDDGRDLVAIAGLRLQRVQAPMERPADWSKYANWFYDLRWEPLPASAAGPATHQPPQSWLIFADQDGVGGKLAESLRARGDSCVAVRLGESSGIAGDGTYTVDPKKTGEIQRVVEKVLAAGPSPLHGVVYLWGLDSAAPSATTATTLQADQERGVGAVVQLVQALVGQPVNTQPRLWIGTRGAQAVGAPAAVSLSQAPLWGVGRTVALEEPQLWGGIADLDPAGTHAEAVADLMTMIRGGDREDQLAFRGGQRYGYRLARLREAPSQPKSFKVRADGSYWIAGGISGIGLELARWLVGLGARHLVLIGRTALPPRERWENVEKDSPVGRQIAAVREMEARGAAVCCAAVDVADEAALHELLVKLEKAGSPPVRGAFHTAVRWGERSLRDLDAAELNAVMHPKVLGGWALHHVLADAPLDFFVVFSSAVSFMTAIGRSAYAAGNAFLDALAHQRRAEGRPVLCVNSGPWAEVGLSATDYGQKVLVFQGAHGIRPMTPKQGCEMIRLLLEQGPVQAGVIDIDWWHLAQTYGFVKESPMLARLAQEECAAGPQASAAPADAAKTRDTNGFVAPRNELERLVVQVWQEVLNVENIGAFDNFFTLGGHSIRAAIAANKLQELLGEKVHFVSLFDAQTVADLAVYLADHYPQAVARLLGKEPAPKQDDKPGKIDAAKLDQLRQAVATWPIFSKTPPAPEPKNPPAIFVLCSPRSGSTLLRVMLAGHPRLFAPPELSLLSFQTLADRKNTFSGRNSYRVQGTVRALQEIQGWTEDQAHRFMAQHEGDGWTTQRLYRFMQEALGNRLLVDKTPHYAMDLAILRRSEQFFRDARYIHLLRHPYGMIHSWEEVRMDAIFTSKDYYVPPRELGELTWLLCNQNIVDFLKEVPRERQLQVRYEDLVQDPRKRAEELCRFLGQEFNAEMVQPYNDNAKRMTDGRGHLGDPNFHKHREIDAGRADRWRQSYGEDFLSEMTWHLAESLGYKRGDSRVGQAESVRPQPQTQPNVAPTNDVLANATESEIDALLKDLLVGEGQHR